MLPYYNRLKEWVNRNIMKFINGKHKSQHLGRNNHRHQPKLRNDQLKSSLAEEDPVVLVHQLTVSQQPALMVTKANSLLPALGREFPVS